MQNNSEKTSFALKITNWCNLRCAHCCECSGPNIAQNLMPLPKVEDYIRQFSEMPISQWEHLVFTGGEAMAPYFSQKNDYMAHCLETAVQYHKVPFIKTNGAWGEEKALRSQILGDLANVAYKTRVLMSMDISIDEFHNNINGVAQIINDVISSDVLTPAIRISLVGLKTPGSKTKFLNLVTALEQQYKLQMVAPGSGVLLVAAPGKQNFMQIIYDFNTPVSRVGRARDIILGDAVAAPDGFPHDDTGHCLLVDNNDIAVLNYKYRQAVGNSDLFAIYKSLLGKVK